MSLFPFQIDPESEPNPLNSLPLETQLFYQTTKYQIDRMSFEDLKQFNDLLFISYILQQQYLKDIMKSQIVNDNFYNNN